MLRVPSGLENLISGLGCSMLSFNSGTAADNVPESATFLFDWCIMNE